jgi:hypothetical protein
MIVGTFMQLMYIGNLEMYQPCILGIIYFSIINNFLGNGAFAITPNVPNIMQSLWFFDLDQLSKFKRLVLSG